MGILRTQTALKAPNVLDQPDQWILYPLRSEGLRKEFFSEFRIRLLLLSNGQGGV